MALTRAVKMQGLAGQDLPGIEQASTIGRVETSVTP
jgi:hypothetical protein